MAVAADVWHDQAAGTWLLQTRSTGYAFGLADAGAALRHLHWGPGLRAEVPAALLAVAGGEPPRWDRSRSGARELPDEYVPWGGLRFDEPSLKAEYADGTRSTEWQYAAQRLTRQAATVTLELDFTDTAYGLTTTLAYRVYDGFDVIERWAVLRHGGGQPVVIRQAHSANWWLPDRARWRLRYLHGGWGAETRLAEATLGPGKLVLESRRGTTSHQFNPWFTLDPGGQATEDGGEIWSGALAWSGSWKLVYELTSAGHLHACGGLNDFDWALRLLPGDEIVLPSFPALYTDGGFGAASREWHAWARAHVIGRGDRTGVAEPHWRSSAALRSPSPAASSGGGPEDAGAPGAGEPGPGPRLRPVLYNSWEATSFAVTQDGQERLAERAARIGVERFVVDDGWFRGRNNDHAGLGDWTVDEAKFPLGLGPLVKRVNSLGMSFGLWVEPEMVNPDSDLYRAHPDWVYHFAHRTRTEHRNQLVLNLARPDVAEWVFGQIDRLLTENNIEFIKWDMNRPFSEPGWPAEAGHNPERVWVDHVRSLYAILDGLRAAHPGVEFESCSGGGGRADLGILGRVEQIWTSDNTDAWDRILIQEGFTQIFPPQVMMAWVTDSPNWWTERRASLRFRFHVAMAGALGIGGDLSRWTEREMAEAAELIATYKVIRPVIQHGRLYRLASVTADPYGACQYLTDDGTQVVILAWWGPSSYGGGRPALRLAALDPGARYTDADSGQEYWGAELRHEGLQLPGAIRGDFVSALVRLVRRDS
jgi:alpha-galactosidase